MTLLAEALSNNQTTKLGAIYVVVQVGVSSVWSFACRDVRINVQTPVLSTTCTNAFIAASTKLHRSEAFAISAKRSFRSCLQSDPARDTEMMLQAKKGRYFLSASFAVIITLQCCTTQTRHAVEQ